MNDWRNWVPWVFFGLIAALFIAWYLVERITTRKSRLAEQAVRRERWNQARQALALECRACGEAALPVPTTSNQYRCDHCGREFAGARHGLDETAFW